MKRRCTNTAATASSWGIPAAVRARIIPASTTPMPPGHRRDPADHRSQGEGDQERGEAQVLVEGVQGGPEGHGHEELADDLAAEDLDQVARVGGEHLQVAPHLGGLRSELGGGQAAPTAGWRTRVRAGPRRTATTMTMSQTRWPSVLGRNRPRCWSGDEPKWNCDRAMGMAMRNRPPLTIQLAVEISTPELTASVASYPCCWKNRTRVASDAHRSAGQGHERVRPPRGPRSVRREACR